MGAIGLPPNDILLTLFNHHIRQHLHCALIIADLHLYSPMYFILVNLSFIYVCLSSVTTPQLTSDFLKANKTISLRACVSQIFGGTFFLMGQNGAACVHGL